jgi:hypothetical protein
MRTSIEQRVMANVAVIYTARKMLSRTALKAYVFFLSLVGVAFFVSVPHITQNLEKVAHGGVGSVALFIFTAILSTTIIVQIALLLGAIAFASFVADFVRNNRPQFA